MGSEPIPPRKGPAFNGEYPLLSFPFLGILVPDPDMSEEEIHPPYDFPPPVPPRPYNLLYMPCRVCLAVGVSAGTIVPHGFFIENCSTTLKQKTLKVNLSSTIKFTGKGSPGPNDGVPQ